MRAECSRRIDEQIDRRAQTAMTNIVCVDYVRWRIVVA